MIDKIFGIIDDKEDEIIDFTRSLVKTRSENPPGNESAVAELIIKKLSEYGIVNIEIKKKEERRPNILASLEFEKSKPILLYNGHMDTKPPGDLSAWDHDPYSGEIINDVIYGLGSSDMKGGVAAITMAAASLIEAKANPKGSLLLNFVADEEKGSIYGTKWLVENDYIKADAGLVAEPSGLHKSFDSLSIAVRGIVTFDITAHGTQMHSSLSGTKGCVNACLKLSELLTTMSKEFTLNYTHALYPKGPTISLADFIHGGVQYAVIPGTCTVGNDIRTIPGMTSKETAEEVNLYLNKLMKKDPDLKVDMHVKSTYEPAKISPKEPIVISTLKAAEKVLKFKPQLVGFPATDDASFLISDGIPTIPAFGPGFLSRAHKPNEKVEIKAIIDAAKIYAIIALDYLNAL